MSDIKYKEGNMIGRLKLIERWVHVSKKGHRHAKGLFICFCGEWFESNISSVVSGNTRSCGCIRTVSASLQGFENSTHGLRYHKVHKVWASIKQRCYNPNTVSYVRYGGRGITMYPQWKDSFISFFDYVTNLPSYSGESRLGQGPNKLTIDRIDNDGGYEPGNLRWATSKEQANNKMKSPKT